MMWDDAKPAPKAAIHLGEDLAALSIAELEERITRLNREIERIATAIASKRAHEAAAASLFKRP